MKFKNFSIKFKLFFAYSAVSIAVFSVSFTLLFFQMRENLETQIRKELSTSNQTITDMVEIAATVSIKNHLRAIAEKNHEIIAHVYGEFRNQTLTESQARAKAAGILISQSVGETGYIYCIDSSGMAVVHPREKIRGKDFSYRAFIREQILRKEGYLEYDWKNPGEVKERPKALYMTYFEPWDWIISVSSYKSEFAKLVSIDDLRDRILGLRFGITGYSYIIDTLGNIVIHPEVSGNFFNVQDEQSTKFIQQMIDRKTGYLTYFWKNPSEDAAREKFVAFDHIPDFNWIIASSSYTSEVFFPLSELRTRFLLILIAAVLVTGLVSMIVSTTITRPLTAFIKRFERGARGDLTSKIDETGQDELGKLSVTFNRFMDRMKSYQTHINAEIQNRKETEQELQTLRNYLADIIDSMPSTLIGIDTGLCVTFWNEKAVRVTGISVDEARGRPINRLLPRFSDHIPLIQEGLTASQIRRQMKHPFIQESGETRYEDITIYPLAGPGGHHGAVIRIDDVTDILRMEETLIQNEKMLSVGGLAAGMAHEINNPLAGVIQNASLLASRLTDPDMPANIRAADRAGTSMGAIRDFMAARDIPRIIRGIQDSGTRMAEIVDNMLSFSRKGDTSFSSHNPADLMDKTLDIAATDYDLKQHYDFKSIAIVKDYEDNLPMVTCESGKIQQVLLNILNNGAQAMSENPAARKSKFILRLSREKRTHMLRMEIQDNGPGMTPEVRKRIFEPFFTTKPVGVGTGLGLSVSYFIITENHKGTLNVASQPGKGSRFIIRLPLSSP